MEAETLVLDLLLENKLGNKLFHPKERSAVNFFGHIESIVNWPGTETHWQDTWQLLICHLEVRNGIGVWGLQRGGG